MEKKKIPLKNYILLGSIILFTIMFVLYARGWYIAAEDYYQNNSIILDTVAEIHSEEIANYAVDNPSFILYAASGDNADIKKFEKEFKKFILKNDLNNRVLYLNLSNVNVADFNNQLNLLTTENVKSTLTDKNSSAIYIFNAGKIVKVIGANTNIDNINVVFHGYGMIEND